MKRRDALSNLSFIAGGTIILPQVILSGCVQEKHAYELFIAGDTELLNEIANTIIPDTPNVPGAKAANVGDFIQSYVTNCFDEVDQKVFLEGFSDFKKNTEKLYGKNFINLDDDQRSEIISTQENKYSEYQSSNVTKTTPHFYHLLKNTVLFGYFTSEIGSTKALRYVPIPGYQKGEIPYEGEKAWAL